MRFSSCPFGPLGANMYVLSAFPHSDGVIIVDPCVSLRKAVEESFDIDIDPSKVEGIFITHGHFDHMYYIDNWVQSVGDQVPVYLNEKDFASIKDSAANCSSDFETPVTFNFVPTPSFQANNKMFFDNRVKCSVINTPGHSKGEVCYMFEEIETGEKVFFSGDMLFAGSIGRTDMYGGDDTEMRESIELLRNIPFDAVVLPGHGPATSLNKEKRTNPYFH